MSTHSGNGHRTETPDVSHIRNEEVTHEKSDINVNGVLTFVVALTIMTIGVYIGMVLLFNRFQGQAEKEPKPGPMALSQGERLPPEPRLQSAPGFQVTLADGNNVNLERSAPDAEYKTVLSEWSKTLKGDTKDASGNPASLPIDQAIKQVVSGDGLPTRTKDASTNINDYAIGMPTAASSGRVSEKRMQ